MKGAQRQVQKVPGGDPAVTGFSVGACNNPTLDPNDPNGNALAKTAAPPQDCDRQGPAQCAAGTGGAKNIPTALKSADTGAAAGAGGAVAADQSATGGMTSAGSAISEDTGAAAKPMVLAATPQAIPTASIGLWAPIALVAVGLGLLLATLLPPLLGRRSPRGPPRRMRVQSAKEGTR